MTPLGLSLLATRRVYYPEGYLAREPTGPLSLLRSLGRASIPLCLELPQLQ